MGCLIIFKSVTYAQSAQALLAKNGIVSYITRPPVAMGAGSCSYGLKINDSRCRSAEKMLSGTGIPVLAVFESLPNGDWGRAQY